MTARGVQDIIDAAGFSALQKAVFAMCFLIVLCDGFDTAAIGYVAPSLVQEWGVAKPQLAPVLSAALFGLALGALGAGPLADRFGRRGVLIASVFAFALASLGCAGAGDLGALTLWRFAAGVGLGAAMPNAVTLTSEYSPSARRALITNAMFCGFPLGAALGGFLAAWLIPHFGWRSVFVVGGVAPLALGVALIVALPESLAHLAARRPDAPALRKALARLAPGEQGLEPTSPPAQGEGLAGARVALSAPLRFGAAMLCLAYFMGLVIFYALINWLPLLLREARLDPTTATLITAAFPLGGVGAVAAGWFMDRGEADRTLAILYALTAASVAALGLFLGAPAALMAMVFVAGIAMNTAQASMPALAAAFFPTAGRATGVALMLGVGRFGGVAGSFLVGALAQMAFGLPAIFLCVAVPGVVAAGALAAKRRASARARGGAGGGLSRF